MRNLVEVLRWRRAVSSGSTVAAPPSFATDAQTCRSFVLWQDGLLKAFVVNNEQCEEEWTVQLDASDTWFSIAFVAELEGVCCVSSGGMIVKVDSTEPVVEVVGDIEGGIVASAWTLDQEIVAFVTRSKTMITMTPSWQVLAETNLTDVDISKTVNLSWSGNGSFVAMSCAADDGRRVLRVFAQDLSLHAVGRKEDGSAVLDLDDSVSWCPNGSLVAMPQAVRGELFVVFFETNGLRHREFAIPNVSAAATRVTRLSWNGESDLLAVELTDTAAGVVSTRTQLWYRSNYVWYMKWQTSGFGCVWDCEDPYRLGLLSGSGAAQQLAVSQFSWDHTLTSFKQAIVPPPMCQFTLTVASSTPVLECCFSPRTADAAFDGDGMVALLLADGSVAVTPCSRGVSAAVPALRCGELLDGLCLRQLVWVSAAASSDGAADIVLLALHSPLNAVVDAVVELRLRWSASAPCELHRVATHAVDGRVVRMAPYALSRCGAVLHLASSHLLRCDVDADDVRLEPLAPLGEVCYSIGVVALRRASQSQHGDDDADDAASIGVVGLSRRTSRLFVFSTLLSTNCGSFLLHPWHDFVLFTSLGAQPHMSFASGLTVAELLKKTARGSTVEGDPADTFLNAAVEHDAKCSRAVERGARLVAAIPFGSDVVMQMPRGNLETVAPRALTLASCRQLIDSRQYGTAMELMRKHRVDLNLLWDHDPAAFQANVDVAVSQITEHDRWDLFLVALRDDDVTGGKYMRPLRPRDGGGAGVDVAAAETKGKRNRACQCVRSAIERLPRPGSLQLAVITSLVCQVPAALDDALAAVQRVKAAEDAAGAAGANVAVTADKALRHLGLLTDVETLYDVALGMYDVELLALVAPRTQRDPQEYTPVLQYMRRVDPLLQRYEIDMCLKRYPSALRNLIGILQAAPAGAASAVDVAAVGVAMSPFAERVPPPSADMCMQLATEHGLQLEAATALQDPRWSDVRRRLLVSHGQVLVAAGKVDQALVVFMSCTPPASEEAIAAAQLGNLWEMALVVAARAGYTPAQLSKLSLTMARSLRANRSESHQRTAAMLLAEYAGEVDEAVVVLADLHAWADALRVAYKHGRHDLVDTVIAPGAKEHAASLIEHMVSRKQQLGERAAALVTCRRARAAMTADELLNVDGKLYAVSRAAAFAAAAGAGGDDDDRDDGGGSVWTGATSMVGSEVTDTAGRGAGSVSGKGESSARSVVSMGLSFFQDDAKSIATQHTSLQSYISKKRQRKQRAPQPRQSRRQAKGSSAEDAGLVQQIAALKPSSELFDEARLLIEALVVMGVKALPGKVQDALSSLVQFVADMAPPPPAVPCPATVFDVPSAADGKAGVEPTTAAPAAPVEMPWTFDVLKSRK